MPKTNYVPKQHWIEPRAAELYGVWRDMILATSEGYDPEPLPWQELDDQQRNAWLAVAGQPISVDVVEFIEGPSQR